MKVTVDIECTPEEARRFMGLPDFTPVHDSYLAKVKSSIEQGGLTPDSIEQLVRQWAPMGEAGMALWRQLVDGVGNKPKA